MFRRIFKSKRIYMDFAAATPLESGVVRAMQDAFPLYGNPSSPHEEGRRAHEALENARQRIARTLSVKSDSLVFTGSGTESNNLAIVGTIDALVERGAHYSDLHIISSTFEHSSVLKPLKHLESRGVSVTYLTPNSEGYIEPSVVKESVRPETVLITLAAAQGEIGTIQDIRGIRQMLEDVRSQRKQNATTFAPEGSFPILHTDASQSLFADFSPEHVRADLVTYDAQKIMGPKGVGLLYRASSVPLSPVLKGGKQERRLRPGTENVVGVVGMARAFEIAKEKRKERLERIEVVRQHFIQNLQKEVPEAQINSSLKKPHLANIVNISVLGADGDYLATLLDAEGIAVSPRSACIASGEPSEAVLSITGDEKAARGTIRFSFGPGTTKSDVLCAVHALKRSLQIIDIK